jgi:hypothetical protein
MSKGQILFGLMAWHLNIFNISLQLDSFRSGSSITQEEDIKAKKGLILLSEISL